jgi:ABC-type transporter MlaC component
MAIGVIDRLRKLKSPAAVLVGILFLVEPFSAAAGTLANQLRATVDKVVTILQDARLKPAAQKTKCRGQLRQVIEPQFDFQEMAKRSLGPHWHGHNREQQTTFVTLFTDLLAESLRTRNSRRRTIYLPARDGGCRFFRSREQNC